LLSAVLSLSLSLSARLEERKASGGGRGDLEFHHLLLLLHELGP
jgi:hypothetical protein